MFQALLIRKVSATLPWRASRALDLGRPTALTLLTLSVAGLDKDGKPRTRPTQTIEVRKGTTTDKVTYDSIALPTQMLRAVILPSRV